MAVLPALPPLALVYHGVDDVPLRRDPYGLFVAPRDVRRHIPRLRSWGYSLVTFGRLATLADERRAHAAAPGVEIGSHSVRHDNLAALSRDEAERDLARSKQELEEITGTPVDVAAYPFGLATAETAEACRRAGYRAACRISGEGSWSDPYNLPRQGMDNGSTMLPPPP